MAQREVKPIRRMSVSAEEELRLIELKGEAKASTNQFRFNVTAIK